jgi:Glycosyl transferase family 4 group
MSLPRGCERCWPSVDARAKMLARNIGHVLMADSADALLSPTMWQLRQFPSPYRHRVNVLFDGVDPHVMRPNATAHNVVYTRSICRAPTR